MIQSSLADDGLGAFGGPKPCPPGYVRRRLAFGKSICIRIRSAGKKKFSPQANKLRMQARHVLKTIKRMAMLRKKVRAAVIANYLKKYQAFRIAIGRPASPRNMARVTGKVHGLIKKLGARVVA